MAAHGVWALLVALLVGIRLASSAGISAHAITPNVTASSNDANLTRAQLKASFIRHHGFWDACAFLCVSRYSVDFKRTPEKCERRNHHAS